MVFHWSLSDSKSPQVSRIRLRILAVLSNAVIWIVSSRPPTYYYYYTLSGFHTSDSWWSFTGVWLTASLLKFTGLFLVFGPILIWLWSPLVIWFLSLPVPLPSLKGLFRIYHLHLVSPSDSCSMLYFSYLASYWYLSLFSISFNFTPWSAGVAKSTIR